MLITKPTFFIAELGGDAVELVRSMRMRFNPDNVQWPADITIARSSGVGTLKNGQSLDFIVETLKPIVSTLKFSEVEFISIERFPDTGIYYLKLQRANFDQMHKAVVSSGLQFNDIEWPYNPHCTLHWKTETSQVIDEFFGAVEIPTASFIERFSLYQPEKNGGNRIFTF